MDFWGYCRWKIRYQNKFVDMRYVFLVVFIVIIYVEG